MDADGDDNDDDDDHDDNKEENEKDGYDAMNANGDDDFDGVLRMLKKTMIVYSGGGHGD